MHYEQVYELNFNLKNKEKKKNEKILSTCLTLRTKCTKYEAIAD